MTEVSEPPFTYEDIEPYTYVRYLDRPGWVLDKGDHISNATGEHIYIEFYDEKAENNPAARHLNVHRKSVNRKLKKRDVLWVDFGHKIYSRESQ